MDGLLRAVGLRPDQAAQYPHELSGGQRQRAVLARALATRPELLVCDEPISALDVSIQAQVINLLGDLQEQFGLAMLFISHDLKVVRLLAHEIAVMYLGTIVERGDPGRIFAAPAHPYTVALLASVPDPSRRQPHAPPERGAAEPRRPSAGLPVPPALPSGRRALPDRAAATAPSCGWQAGGMPSGGGSARCGGAPAGAGPRLMLRFAVLRCLRALLTVLGVVTLAFVILRASSDPALVLLGPDAPPEAVRAFRESWGLDQPIWVQYLDYLGAMLGGDFGTSMREGTPALSVVLQRVPATLAITLPALALSLLVGIPAGLLAALRRNTAVDRGIMALAVAGFTVPSFILASLLILLFAVRLGWLPSGGPMAGATPCCR